MLSDCEHHILGKSTRRISRHCGSGRGSSCRASMFCNRKPTLYITIDEKPKRPSSFALKRLRNMIEDPAVAVVVDRYDEDWARLGWVMLRGRAEILSEGVEHEQAQALLRSRYPQLRAMEIAQYPVIAVRIERTTSWGELSVVSKISRNSPQLLCGTTWEADAFL